MTHPAVSLADAVVQPFWLDSWEAPDPCPRLVGDVTADLLVVGGGFGGLWSALRAKERDPERDVVVLEAHRVAWAASGRNGGMVSSSLTHGLAHGVNSAPKELRRLEELGVANLEALESTVARYKIDCGFERNGKLVVATRPHDVEALHQLVSLADGHGRSMRFLDRDAVRSQVRSPTYLAGVEDPDGYAIVDPARLAWGLKRTCIDLGVRIYENTPASSLARHGAGVAVRTPYGAVRSRQVVLATNAFPSLLRRLRLYTVPVYDYALVTEPLDRARLDSIGWNGRQAMSDLGSQFHYYRLTPDNRVLWGGYDAIYPYASDIRAERDQRPETFASLATHFFETFPQLAGVRFTHAWGGVIDTCSRFYAFYGTALDGTVAYSLGHTGLGVAATRFAADVVLDLLCGEPTELTCLELVRSRPLPFPPEPLRWLGIELTRRSMAAADGREGRRNLWLRTLDRVGLGFDS